MNLISYNHVIPHGPDGSVLPSPYVDKGPLGVIRLSYVQSKIETETKSIVQRDCEFLGFALNLSDNIHFSLEGFDANHVLRTAHFNLVYLPRKAGVRFEFQPGKYGTFTIEFTRSYLEFWLDECQALYQFLENIKSNKPAILTTSPLKLDPRIFCQLKNFATRSSVWPSSFVAAELANSWIIEIIALCIKVINSSARQATLEVIQTSLANEWLALENSNGMP